ncbi:uncharacterized protein [Anabrus simplex]|uniref:uncharacterized protein n=1 Tax=Anabrus simplex TaxID=316456 RepID=UPI0035A3A3BA
MDLELWGKLDYLQEASSLQIVNLTIFPPGTEFLVQWYRLQTFGGATRLFADFSKTASAPEQPQSQTSKWNPPTTQDLDMVGAEPLSISGISYLIQTVTAELLTTLFVISSGNVRFEPITVMKMTSCC